MSAFARPMVADQTTIPQFRCPHCGAGMRLARIEPELEDRRNDVMTFDCECGHTFQHSVARKN